MFQIVVEELEEGSEKSKAFVREATDAYAIFTSVEEDEPQSPIFELFTSGTQAARHSWLFDVEDEPRLLAFNADGVLEDSLNEAVLEVASNLQNQSASLAGVERGGLTVTVASDETHNFVVIGDSRLLAIYDFRQFGLAAGLLRRIVGREGDLL